MTDRTTELFEGQGQDGYLHRRHNKTLLMAHVILVTKYRKKLFFEPFRSDVKQYLYETCVRYHWRVRRMETDKDHVHILLQYPPTDSITKIVSALKQHSTYLAWKSYGRMLKKEYWKEKTLWSDGYFAASVGQVSQKTIEQYIQNQG